MRNHHGRPGAAEHLTGRGDAPAHRRDEAAHRKRQAVERLAAGTHRKAAREPLGHSSCAIAADIDSHVAPVQQREAAEKLGHAIHR